MRERMPPAVRVRVHADGMPIASPSEPAAMEVKKAAMSRIALRMLGNIRKSNAFSAGERSPGFSLSGALTALSAMGRRCLEWSALRCCRWHCGRCGGKGNLEIDEDRRFHLLRLRGRGS